MARSKNLIPWTDEQAREVEETLMCFNGADEVCAAVGCKAADLNWLCRQAFGLTFKQAEARFQTVGRSRLRKALFEAALAGNAKALDTLVREQLGMGPVEARRRTAAKAEQARADETDF